MYFSRNPATSGNCIVLRIRCSRERIAGRIIIPLLNEKSNYFIHFHFQIFESKLAYTIVVLIKILISANQSRPLTKQISVRDTVLVG